MDKKEVDEKEVKPEARLDDYPDAILYADRLTESEAEDQPEPLPYQADERTHPKRPAKFSYSREEMRSLRRVLEESNLLHLSFYFLDYLLRAQTALFEQIFSQKELPRIILSMSVLSAILAGIYGLVMGMYNGLFQALASGVKLPILFLLTAIICIPSLYTFNVLLGQSFKFLQTVTLMVMTIGTTTILLASLAPIAFFFTLTTQNYQFLLLLHVLIFGLCGIYGVRYLYRGCAYLAFRLEQPLNTLLLRIWIAIYAVVGMQLGWRLRPFIGYDGSPFQLFREQGDGNFYTAVWRALNNLF
ncbi:MAG: actin-binding WH2 domain-containing protein [Elainellaceae cyanobacterium]